MSILLSIFGIILILLCLFTVLVIMIQKPKGDGGMGAALGGGGGMESALGVESGSMLNKLTIYCVIIFFVVAFALYLGALSNKDSGKTESGEDLLDGLSEVSEPAPEQVIGDAALTEVPEALTAEATEATTEDVPEK